MPRDQKDIYKALRSEFGSLTISELARGTGYSNKEVKAAVERLQAEGKIEKAASGGSGSGKYYTPY